MTMSDEVPDVSERAGLLPVLALFVGLVGLALGAVAIGVAVTRDDGGSATLTMPVAMVDHFAAMTEHMTGMAGMRAMADPEAMRQRCVTMMGGVAGIDAGAFCDSMVATMTTNMGTAGGMMMQGTTP